MHQPTSAAECAAIVATRYQPRELWRDYRHALQKGDRNDPVTRAMSHETTVGTIANPASGRDIRRLVASASVFPVAEKCNMIIRLLAALNATGVERALLMPDVGGISDRLRRAIISRSGPRAWSQVEFL